MPVRNACARPWIYLPALLERHNRQQPLQGLSSLSLGDREALNLDNFAIVCKIGEGSFGKVVLARKKDDGALHAVKAVRKEKLLGVRLGGDPARPRRE